MIIARFGQANPAFIEPNRAPYIIVVLELDVEQPVHVLDARWPRIATARAAGLDPG